MIVFTLETDRTPSSDLEADVILGITLHHQTLSIVWVSRQQRGIDLNRHIEVRIADRLNHLDRIQGRNRRIVIASPGTVRTSSPLLTATEPPTGVLTCHTAAFRLVPVNSSDTGAPLVTGE